MAKPAADGSGPSLQRIHSLAYGNDPINWEGALPTPGRIFIGGPTPIITAQPVSLAVVATREAMFHVSAAGPEPIFYQWRRNGVSLANANSSTLLLTDLRFTDAGNYTVLVFNENGSVESDAATLTVLVPANILNKSSAAEWAIRARIRVTIRSRMRSDAKSGRCARSSIWLSAQPDQYSMISRAPPGNRRVPS